MRILCLVLPALVSSGCGGGGPAVDDPAEQAVIDYVTEHNGTVEIESGHVVKIDLHGSGIQDADLVQFISLSQLKHLDLRNTKVTDGAVEHILKMPALEYLDISGTEVANETADKLRKDNRNLEVSGPDA